MKRDSDRQVHNLSQRLACGSPRASRLLLLGVVTAGVLLSEQRLHAQSTQSFVVPVGTDDEVRLRDLQLVGQVPLYPWTIRSFSPREVDYLTSKSGSPKWECQWIAPKVTTYYNSQYPYGFNDGPIWQGRGATIAIQAGIAARWKGFSLAVAPVYARAANRTFELIANGQTGNGALRNQLYPMTIDAPQRFGDQPYTILDPGLSTLRWDGNWITAGISTANQWWGPATEYPYLLGSNAAGFPHAFLGTARPLSVRIARLHTKMIWGTLQQSQYSPVTGSKYYRNDAEPGRRRFATGIALSITPGFSDRLEFGFGRFFHLAWPEEGVGTRALLRPFDAFLKDGAQSGLPQNQLASMWFRWVLPKSGFEFYSEYGREDYNIDRMDFYLEPDHARAYTVGLRKVFGMDTVKRETLRVEWFNGQVGTTHRHRASNATYVHTQLRQGHTYRGQLLGSYVGAGAGAGAAVGFDHYSRQGRLSITLRRLVTGQNGTFFTGYADSTTAYQDDILPSVDVDWLRRIGRFEVTSGIGISVPTRNFYRTGTPNTRSFVRLGWR